MFLRVPVLILTSLACSVILCELLNVLSAGPVRVLLEVCILQGTSPSVLQGLSDSSIVFVVGEEEVAEAHQKELEV